MLIKHIGHSEFVIMLESGLIIATDPYDKECGYPERHIRADVVLVSHHHHDHDAVNMIDGHPMIIDTTGKHTLAPDITVTAYRVPHDDAGGSKRGFTLMFLIEAERMRIVHLGDIGCCLQNEYVMALAPADILMVPVGGYFTIDASQAKTISEVLGARVIIPMHYRTAFNPKWPIAEVDEFLELFSGECVERKAEALRITCDDILYQPRIAVI